MDEAAAWAARAAWAAAAAVATTGVLYAFPGIGPLDAGDFVTAAASLGVPHATGFPVVTQAGHGLTLLPLGGVAWRVGLVSALASAVAAGCVVWCVALALRLRAGGPAVAAMVAAAFVTADTLALHARVAEAYGAGIALAGLSCVALERLRATGDARWRAVLAVVMALGLANHALFRLWFVPLVAASLWPRRSDGGATTPLPQHLAVCVGLGMVTVLGAYLYLPASALRLPEHAWGDPRTFERVWAHIMAADIRAAYAAEMRPSVASLAVYGQALWAQLARGLGAAAWLGLVGVVLVVWRGGVAVRVAALLAAIDVGYAVALNPMGIRDHQCGQWTALFLAASAGGAVGWGVEAAARRVDAPRLVAVLALACGLAASTTGRASLAGRSGADWSADDVAVSALAFARPDATLWFGTDTTVGAALYVDVVLDARPDAAIGGTYLLSDDRALAQWTRHQPFDVFGAGALGEARGATARHTAALLARHVGERPVYWEATGDGEALPDAYRLRGVWPIGEVVPAWRGDGGASAEGCVPTSRGLCGGAPDVAFGGAARDTAGRSGVFYRRYVARLHAYEGARAHGRGDMGAAGAAYERAHALAPDVPAWATSLAVLLANTGRMREALGMQEAALALGPPSAVALRNAATFAAAAGDDEAAARYHATLHRLYGQTEGGSR